MMLLDSVIDDMVGKDAVVIGKSNIVGKPIAMLLLERECTVTVTHIYTENLPEIARKADIIIAAAGAPELVRGVWVKPGAVVIDVGITRLPGADGKEKLVGDVKFDEVQHARAVTPVPGGGTVSPGDGNTVVVLPDGRVIVVTPGGHTVTVNPDGSTTTSSPPLPTTPPAPAGPGVSAAPRRQEAIRSPQSLPGRLALIKSMQQPLLP
jgi:hypothetical protein